MPSYKFTQEESNAVSKELDEIAPYRHLARSVGVLKRDIELIPDENIKYSIKMLYEIMIELVNDKNVKKILRSTCDELEEEYALYIKRVFEKYESNRID